MFERLTRWSNMDVQIYEELFRKIVEEANSNQTQQLQESINTVRSEVTQIKSALTIETERRKEIEVKYQYLQNKYNDLDKQIRKNNIVIFGIQHQLNNNIIPDKKQKLLDVVILTLKDILDVEIHRSEVNDIFTLGKHKNDSPILVKFCSLIKKEEILSKCRNLKGTNIIITDDLNLEERKTKAELYQYLKQAKQNKQSAYIRGDKLYINKRPYTLEELKQQSEESALDTDEVDEENLDDIQQDKSNRVLETTRKLKKKKVNPDNINTENLVRRLEEGSTQQKRVYNRCASEAPHDSGKKIEPRLEERKPVRTNQKRNKH